MSTPTDYIFLHGGGQGGWIWAETIAALRRQGGGDVGEIVLLDLPGCGLKGGAETDSLTTADIVDELLADIDRGGARDAVLVGHSQAGTVLPRLAERRPDLFRRLVFVACAAPLPGQTVSEMMGTSRHGESATEVGWPLDPKTHDLAARLPAMFCNDMDPAQAAAFLALLGKDAWASCLATETRWRYDHMANTRSSYIVCLHDGILPVGWQETFAERLQVDRVVRVAAGHQVMTTQPEALAKLLIVEAKAA